MVHVIIMFVLYNESFSVLCHSPWQREASLKAMLTEVGVFGRMWKTLAS